MKEKNQSWLSFAVEMVLILSVVLFVRFYVFQFFRVSGPSMCPTLNVLDEECQMGQGEFIFVNEMLYNFIREPERGEVVVFKPPHKDDYYIKRIMGVGGDTITIEDGKVYLANADNEKTKLEESYLSPRNKDNTQVFFEDEFVVPEGKFLLFGDNRAKSFDARHCYYQGGCDDEHSPFVSMKNITGRAEAVLWPLTKIRKVEVNDK